jgi:hypothetical protein
MEPRPKAQNARSMSSKDQASHKLDLLKVGKKKPISLQPARCEKSVLLPM